jgi:hypothetical protein
MNRTGKLTAGHQPQGNLWPTGETIREGLGQARSVWLLPQVLRVALCVGLASPCRAADLPTEEFVGPFPSWAEVMRERGESRCLRSPTSRTGVGSERTASSTASRSRRGPSRRTIRPDSASTRNSTCNGPPSRRRAHALHLRVDLGRERGTPSRRKRTQGAFTRMAS